MNEPTPNPGKVLGPPPTNFPEYPAPTGLPVATPQQTKPLMKMMRMMLKPRKFRSPTKHAHRKKVKFY